MINMTALLRKRDDEHEQPVGFVELFFDLVFVFAVTQLAVVLAKDLSFTGLWQGALLFVATWWLWLLSSWAMNWLEPERPAVRILLFVLMLGGLVMAAVMPAAFTRDGGLVFAALYVFMQVGRTLFTIYALRVGDEPQAAQNFTRMGLWLAASGVLWIAGGLADPQERLLWWTAAAAVDLLGPSTGHRVPGMGFTSTRDWNIVGGHLSERCGLFIILSLGEIIIVLGQTFSATTMSPPAVGALIVSFLGTVMMWWIYFDVGAKHATKRIEEEDDPGRIARIAYTYFHMPIVAGIVLTAVADKKVFGAPLDLASTKLAMVALAGPALFLIGETAFKRVTARADRLPRSHLVGLALLIGLAPFATQISAVALTGATTAILVTVAVLERMLRSEPTPHAEDPGTVVELEM